MTVDLVTFGCRLNAYESEIMRDHAESAGLDDALIFNTCAVTAEAVRQARQSIRRARRERPGARIIVTGCAAQLDPDAFAGMAEVDRVLGNEEKLVPANYLFDFGVHADEKALVNDIMSVTETASHMVAGFKDRARAFVQIQNGCDHRCTFCIIPFARGNSRSVPMGDVIQQIRALVGNGYNEVVLTGVDITSYGHDLPGRPSLGKLVQKILALAPDLTRLRISSIDSIEADPALIETILGEPRLMPHLHLSLQAGDDMILKRMKRRHSRAQSVEFCQMVRAARPEMVFGADLIAGFPTETDEMAQNTLDLVRDCGLTYLHVFPYSEREGTPAAKMPPVPVAVRRARAEALRHAGNAALRAYLAGQVGRTADVLVEQDDMARTPGFAPVRLDRPAPTGRILRAELIGADDRILQGRLVEGYLAA